MFRVNADLLKRYCEFMGTSNAPKNEHYQYQKRLRYYHDLCHKYQSIIADPDSLPYFIRKLHEKNQTIKETKSALDF